MVDQTSVYLTGFVKDFTQEGPEENVLIVFDKKDFSKQEVFKYDNTIVTGEGLWVNGTIYLPNLGKTSEYTEIEQSSELLTFDTKQNIFVSNFRTPSPSTLHALKDQKLLLIEHQNGMFSPISFTIYNTQTGQESYHRLDELNPRPYYIDHVRQLDGNRLLLILAGKALIYDWQAKSFKPNHSI